jgi:ligand-binding sensor domain-containing protein
MLRRIGLTITIVACATVMLAQNHFFRKYDSRQGLPSSEVYHAVQDNDGYMWFSTDHGLVRYDGYQFRTFDVNDGLPENPVFTLYKDSKNRVWFVTLSGNLGFHYKGKIMQYKHNDKLIRYIQQNIKTKYTIFEHFVVDTAENIMFALRAEGLFAIDTMGMVSRLNPREDENSTILVDGPEGRMLIDFAKVYPTKTLILRSSGGKADTFDVSRIFHFRPVGQYFIDAIRLGEDVYFSENNTVIHIRSGELKRVVRLLQPIIKMSSDQQGRIWMSTNGGGGRLFDKELNELDVFLDGEPISSFCEDHEGGLWFTSKNSGIFYIPDQRNKVMVPANIYRQEKIVDVKNDKYGRLWFSTFSTIGSHDGKKVRTFSLTSSGDIIISRIMPTQNGNLLWIGTNRGLILFDVNSGRKISVPALVKKNFRNSGVKSLHYDTLRNKLWVGTFSGFYSISDQMEVSRLYGEDELNRVEALAVDAAGQLFLGNQNGLFAFDGENISKISRNGFGNWRVTALKWRNDSLWIGTREKGLFLLTSDTLISFGRNDGLVSASVNFIELKGGLVIAGTNKGISLLARTADQKSFSVIQNITSGYGLLANEVSAMTSFNNKIIASSAGFLSFLEVDPFQLQRIRMPYHITGIVANNQLIEYPDTGTIFLNHDQNSISINYFAISFFLQGKHNYRHRMVGLESEWVFNQQTTASYPYLPPGNYTFEVQVQNPDGSWSAASQTIKVVVLKPFWMAWWFIALVAMLGLMVLFSLFYAFIRNQNRQKNIVSDMQRYQQQALALQMNPHFLFNALNTVQRYILENDKMASSRYLTRFAGFMRATLDNAQKPDTTLASEIQLLRQYLELESARSQQKFTYEIACDETIDQETTQIPVFLIQPLVENAIHHGFEPLSGNGHIHIKFSREGKNLIVSVQDNGIGREAASKYKNKNSTSLGLSIIEKRIHLINKSLRTNISFKINDLYSGSGEAAGTMAVISFPDRAKTKHNG